MFSMDSYVLALAIIILLTLSAFVAFIASLWRHQAAKATIAIGVSSLLVGVLSVFIYQHQWAEVGAGADESVVNWGSLPDWVYNAPFIIGLVLVIIGGTINISQIKRNKSGVGSVDKEMREFASM